MDQTLYDHLMDYSEIYPMHMPGHKMGRLGSLKNLYTIDVTEVDGTDNLHAPSGVIKIAQEKAAILFGAEKSFFLVNGSTVGLMAAITAVCGEGDSLIVARNCHRSVYDGLITTGVNPIYIYPKIINKNGLVGGIDPEEVRSMIQQNPNAKGLVLTSPTYEGFTSDIRKIAEILHANNKVLIVDEAHGAHFVMHQEFPETALSQGADIVIQSIHKTLPSLTQSAILHINNSGVNENKIQSALRLYETSSPSYVLMTSLDNCRHLLERDGKALFQQYVKNLKTIRKQLKTLKHLQLMDNELISCSNIVDMDMTKILISTMDTNLTGIELEKMLRTDYHIQTEMATDSMVIAMSTVADSEKALNALYDALQAIDDGLKHKQVKDDINYRQPIQPIIKLTPRKAYFADTERASLHEARGAISGDYMIPYPPGIPVVAPGEVITDEIVDCLKDNLIKGINILGRDDIKIIKREVNA
ncbi:aminotransferase class I/II-fold pyridoxal phosphate-dependent enzyme [Vallitalea okinawensis]|uniref:aminotransferase class I/II-fold pyridoxal phosphate-dependent enzyme n=1 Tax=Vallitalea okinawensis TaxID=2078660 RepID=UPI001478EAED|nr:aminotransferase class I/II-fold pyridoxal phosphate-dependent enzyme [Vallitalea okinawensis]